MSTWGEVEQELLRNLLPNGTPDFDGVRRQYLWNLSSYTGRSTIIYETAGFAPPPGVSPGRRVDNPGSRRGRLHGGRSRASQGCTD